MKNINIKTAEEAKTIINAITGFNCESLNWIHRPERADACFSTSNSSGQVIVWKTKSLLGNIDISVTRWGNYEVKVTLVVEETDSNLFSI